MDTASHMAKPGYRFPASTKLAGASAVGDAMTGMRRWDETCVLAERDILLGHDSEKAWTLVHEIRAKLVANYRVAYKDMVEREKKVFGLNSYFTDPAGSALRRDLDSDSDCGGSHSSSDGE